MVSRRGMTGSDLQFNNHRLAATGKIALRSPSYHPG